MMSYFGQCDRVRNDATGEANWQAMMAQKTPITQADFEATCDFDELFGDGEPVEDFMADDPTSGFFASFWGGVPCRFVYTSGFEFIWK